MSTDIAQLKLDMVTLQLQITTLEEDKAKLKAEILTSKSETASLHTQITILVEERNAARAEAAHAKGDVLAVQSGVSAAIEEKTAAHLKELLKLQDQLQLAEEERDLARQDCIRTNDQIANFQSQLSTIIEAHQAKSRSEAELAAKEISALKAKVAALEAQLAQAVVTASLEKSLVFEQVANDRISSDLDSGIYGGGGGGARARDFLLQKEAADQIAYLKSQVLTLEEQREEANKMVAYLRSKINAMKEKRQTVECGAGSATSRSVGGDGGPGNKRSGGASREQAKVWHY